MSSSDPVPEPVSQPGLRLPPLGPTARKVWLAAVIATLLAAAAPMVWNVASSGVEYFVGPGAEFDPANPNNYPDGRAGYVFDLVITALFAAAFLLPLLLTGAQGVLAARAKRATGIKMAVVSLATLAVTAVAGYSYAVAEEVARQQVDQDHGWVFFDILQLMWVTTIVSAVALLLTSRHRPNKGQRDLRV